MVLSFVSERSSINAVASRQGDCSAVDTCVGARPIDQDATTLRALDRLPALEVAAFAQIQANSATAATQEIVADAADAELRRAQESEDAHQQRANDEVAQDRGRLELFPALSFKSVPGGAGLPRRLQPIFDRDRVGDAPPAIEDKAAFSEEVLSWLQLSFLPIVFQWYRCSASVCASSSSHNSSARPRP